MISKRRLVRSKALEVLYAHQMSKENVDKIKKDLLTELSDLEKYNFACDIINYVLENQKQLDEIIRKNINNWEFERIAVIDRIIIRIALVELLFFPEIPPKVSINEAIELSKMYSTDKSPNFVNGVLDSALKKLNKDGKVAKTGRGLIDFKKEK